MGKVYGTIKPVTWLDVANEATKSINLNFFGGWQYPKCGRTIMEWNIEFRSDKVFKRDKPREKKFNLPPFLHDNLDAVDAIGDLNGWLFCLLPS